jgi:GTPase SAR1 family protein
MLKTQRNPLSNDLMPLDGQVKRTDDPLPNSHVNWLIIGKKGSGKSTLILNLLKRKSSPYYKNYDNIFMISPTACRDSKFADLVDEIREEDKYYEELNDDIINEIVDKLYAYNDDYVKKQEEAIEEMKLKKRKNIPAIRQPSNLLILDDCLHMLPKSGANSSVNKIFTTSRHMKLSIWLLTQKMNKVNPLIRNNSDMITVFPTDNKKEFESISEDWNIDRNRLQKLYDYAVDEPNSFLHISLFGNKPNFFKKFDKIIEE